MSGHRRAGCAPGREVRGREGVGERVGQATPVGVVGGSVGPASADSPWARRCQSSKVSCALASHGERPWPDPPRRTNRRCRPDSRDRPSRADHVGRPRRSPGSARTRGTGRTGSPGTRRTSRWGPSPSRPPSHSDRDDDRRDHGPATPRGGRDGGAQSGLVGRGGDDPAADHEDDDEQDGGEYAAHGTDSLSDCGTHLGSRLPAAWRTDVEWIWRPDGHLRPRIDSVTLHCYYASHDHRCGVLPRRTRGSCWRHHADYSLLPVAGTPAGRRSVGSREQVRRSTPRPPSLIRRLQAEHLPLAEIRRRLDELERGRDPRTGRHGPAVGATRLRPRLPAFRPGAACLAPASLSGGPTRATVHGPTRIRTSPRRPRRTPRRRTVLDPGDRPCGRPADTDRALPVGTHRPGARCRAPHQAAADAGAEQAGRSPRDDRP